MRRAVVIGSGVSGLAAGVELDRSGADFLVIEQSDAVGGAMRSHRAGGYIFEDGPISVFDSDGTFRTFCGDLGIEAEIIESRQEARIRYLYHEGKLVPVPSGPAEILRSPLLTFMESARLAREAFVSPGSEGEEETVSAFLARRFGARVAAKFAGAFVSGVFAGDPDRLSIDAAFPELRAIEREHGSLLRGIGARSAARREGPRPALVSLRSGLGRVADACHARIGDRLRTRARVDALARRGSRVSLSISADGPAEHLEADVVIVATPAPVAAALLVPVAPAAADLVRGIEHASVAVVQAGFTKADLPGLPAGFGFLVPRSAGLESLGWVFLSQIFGGRAPDDRVALSGFFGGVLSPGPLGLADQELGDLAVRELGRAIGMAEPPRADFLRVVRCNEALPQYNLGHRRRIQDLTSMLARDVPEILLAGNYLTGLSVPRCLESGRAAAAAAVGTARSKPAAAS